MGIPQESSSRAVGIICFVTEWARASIGLLVGRDEWLQIVAPALFAFVVLLLWRGSVEMPAALDAWWAGKQALIWALPMYLIFTAAVAFWRTRRDESKVGQWTIAKFLYAEPQLAFTTEWKPTDNGSYRTFKFKNAEPGSLVQYRLEIEGPQNLVWGVVLGKYRFMPEEVFIAHTPLAPRGKAVIGNDRMLELRCFSAPNTIPAIIRVYILSWELHTEEWMDFEQEKTSLRCVLKGPDKPSLATEK